MSTITKLEKPQRAESVPAKSVEVAPGIWRTPGVWEGGVARAGRTRITGYGLVEWRNLGWDDATLLDQFPTLTKADLANAWAYASAHKDEIDRQIADNNLD